VNQKTVTGTLLIVTSLLLIVVNTTLSMIFEYPQILRKPTPYILQLFSAGGAGLIATWYGFLIAAILLIPSVVLLHRFLARDDSPLMKVATVLGVVASIVQMMGLIRWVFVVPYLAQTYLDPASSQATREAVIVAFQTLHRYGGSGLGEHLGYVFTGAWALLAGAAMTASPNFKKWLGWWGAAAALAIIVGVFEPLGFGAAAAVNALGYTALAIWLIVAGVFIWRSESTA